MDAGVEHKKKRELKERTNQISSSNEREKKSD